MPNLLRIDVSPRGDYSVSKKLADSVTAAWLEKNPGGTVTTRDLSKGGPLPFVDLPWIMGAYTPADQHSPETAAAIKVSNELVDELLAADEILIATPMYNFNVPAALKAYIDHIVRFGRTFNEKYEGLATGKKVFVLVAAMGTYGPGSHSESMNFLTPYLKFILGFIGLTDQTIHFADGTSGIQYGQITFEDYIAQHTPKVLEAFSK
jgi:FMN-dependent NADH-azoreductase